LLNLQMIWDNQTAILPITVAQAATLTETAQFLMMTFWRLLKVGL